MSVSAVSEAICSTVCKHGKTEFSQAVILSPISRQSLSHRSVNKLQAFTVVCTLPAYLNYSMNLC